MRRRSLIEGDQSEMMIEGPKEEARAALREVENWLSAAPVALLAKALSELYLRTARRAEDTEDRQALVKLYARELSRYPGDLAVCEIEKYRGTFFPALDELRGPLEKSDRLLKRRRLASALRAFLAGETERRKGPPPSDAQHAKVREWIERNKAAI